MLTSEQTQCMSSHGYCLINAFYDQTQLDQLQAESETLIKRFYTKEELNKHSVYPSDSSDSRISNAVMISEGPSEFPKIDHHEYSAIDRFLQDHNTLLSQITGAKVTPSSRCMLNYQNYFCGSKPVGEHFDGEYLRTSRAQDGVEFTLHEGILPRYVTLLVLKNENNGKGIQLVNNATNEVTRPQLHAGDLIIFDNIALRHRVPRLDNPRTSIGLRNFDHKPLHFVHSENDFLNGDYRRIAEGWVSENVDCHARFKDFMLNEWPTLKEEYAHYF